ncbi:OmpA family protein [Paludibacterium yongneupense]|uniref:OmpA family protein n=1 Tax=Paludibacterium yongneupense TaxID=400061 RepID=UPI0003F4C5E1|nr:OmpA family protein [Paludibacterium yongneupense]
MSKSLLLAMISIAVLSACAAPKSSQDVSISQTSRGVEIRSANSILFDTAKYEVKGSANAFLDQVSVLLKDKTRNNVLIEGYTDNVGSRELNQELSELRALSVMKALVDRGVSKNRIRAQGHGMSHPIADNGSEAGRRLNRRTEIIILGEKQENLGQSPLGNAFDSVVNFGKGLFN